ncbi:hypothetical protein VCRA2119O147_520021 [Vibrio crassostreae]|nr:hypothetical protein VCRA2113O322_240017 [Vibrio crassostreae]CAK2103632.1 hypothetical protein VCRA2117O378_400022 [Vibrio crassostreae]CAK2351406.1 hypothetical protein VCRA2119O386_360017 [Vibrio crassostreae]CAK2364277.1 hypothetical protein VCRA2117O143_450017 [Vibrio crassostreae]CAK2365522.1 hypothetical protein VCRA2117O142_440017 [Vibrio crassostreae]
MKGIHMTQRLIEEGTCRMTKESYRVVFLLVLNYLFFY